MCSHSAWCDNKNLLKPTTHIVQRHREPQAHTARRTDGPTRVYIIFTVVVCRSASAHNMVQMLVTVGVVKGETFHSHVKFLPAWSWGAMRRCSKNNVFINKLPSFSPNVQQFTLNISVVCYKIYYCLIIEYYMCEATSWRWLNLHLQGELHISAMWIMWYRKHA